MKLTKQQQAALMQVYDTWWNSYLNGDVKTYDSFLDDDYHFIGSTNGEEFLNRKDTTAFFDATADQLAGKAELRNLKRTIEELDGGLILITDVADAYVVSEPEWVFYSRFRFTSLMKETKKGWRFIYQHFSAPDTKAQEGETLGTQQITKENEELRDAIKRRTVELEHKNRELEIEASLERVRSRAMAMQSSNELSDLVDTLFKELTKLDFAISMCIINIIDESNLTNMVWAANPDTGKPPDSYLMKFEDYPFHHAMMKGYKARDLKFIYTIEGKEKKIYDEYLFNETEFRKMPKEAQAASKALKRYVASFTFSNFGGLQTVGDEPLSDINLDILARFGKVFDLTYTRFNDLLKAEAQAREAKIEAALEKVRSQTMGMQNSEDLAKVAVVMFDQIRMLGGNLFSCGIVLCDENKPDVDQWLSVPEIGMMPPFFVPKDLDYIHQYRYDQWKAAVELFSIEIQEDEIAHHFNLLYQLPSLKKIVNSAVARGIAMPETPKWEIDYGASFKYGYLLISSLQPFNEAHIFPRFAKVFEQTYTRFLDLQKAEAQAREAKIEAALEKVRSRSLAMHKSEELNEVVTVVFEKFKELQIPVTAVSITIYIHGSKDMNIYVCGDVGTGLAINHYFLPYFSHPITNDLYDVHKKGLDFFVGNYSKEEKNSFYEYVLKLPELKNLPAEVKNMIMQSESYSISIAPAKYSTININDFEGKPLSESQTDVVKRFAKVFDQVYIRFLDLQKAEAQAREAQIEAALERVRSRTMGMQQSTEIGDVAAELFNQMNLLVTNLWTCGFVLCEKDRDEDEWWLSMDTGLTRGFMLPNVGDYTHATLYEGWEKGEAFRAVQLDGNDLQEHYKWLMNLPVAKSIFEEMDAAGLERPDWQKLHAAYFSKGYLVLITREPCGEEEIFKRFAQVFDQTYTRFLDLKKAEAQAREAQIEAALEKVRSRSLAMQKTEELQEVVAVVAEKLNELGVILDANGVIICTYFPDSKDVMHWMAVPDFSGSGSYLLPYFDHPIFNAAWESKINGDDYFSKSFTKEEKDSFFQYAFANSDYRHFPDEFKQWIFQNDKHSLSFAWAKNSALLIPSHTGILPSENDKEILKRFVRVFEQAYIRFMDLQKAEQLAKQAQIDLENLIAAKKKTDDALTELKATQTQLIQSEKMASLGELTAGIAHEIQNPLNFVNNFSEVSKELLDEIKEELEKGNIEDAKEIMNDVIQNLEKINHHGKRADGIVKGMLQHSRSSSGTKEPTDINALADEYLRLAYHGLRAKDKSFNATLKTDFDETIESINIIPQDIGRVILNLITNAFYAVSTVASAKVDGNYNPTVSVSTKKEGDKVLISVKDNGPGIPPKVLEKIFHPFFTTKPTGQGTGLGLSLAYDIVKAHGGELKVETKENEGLPAGQAGTKFIILLSCK